MLSQRIGFVGAGQMAAALARGWVRGKLVPAQNIVAVDPMPAALARLAAELPGVVTGPTVDAAKLFALCDVLVLAVKPQQAADALAQLRDFVTDKQLIVSVAAGVSCAALAEGLAAGGRIIRVMPNTPALIGQGASAYATGRSATVDDAALVEQLLGSVGRAFRVDEKLLDAVTGLSGSGPAFVYVMIEALSDGGVLTGLPRDVATALAAQTVAGAAAMVLETGVHPGLLKDRVASPAGTTIAGLAVLEDAGVRGALVRAVEAAARRAGELGKPK